MLVTHVVLGSSSSVKFEALYRGLEMLGLDQPTSIMTVRSPSQVRDQPMCDAETIAGATNRAIYALSHAKADMAFGLESGLHRLGVRWFGAGWVVVISKDARVGIACTLRVAVSEDIMGHVRNGHEIARACELHYGVENGKADGSGHFEQMSHGRLSRILTFRDAVVAAYYDLLSQQC